MLKKIYPKGCNISVFIVIIPFRVYFFKQFTSLKSDLNNFQYCKKISFRQSTIAHTITFSGSGYNRVLYGFVCVTGQSSTTGLIPFMLKGAEGLNPISGVTIGTNSFNITSSSNTINIPAGIGENWGVVELFLLYDNDSLNITYV